MVVDRSAFESMIEELRSRRSALRLAAEVDPRALVDVAQDFAERTGVTQEVALRVVEDVLGVRPLSPSTPLTKGRTSIEIRAVDED
jgi:hypothetical protein